MYFSLYDDEINLPTYLLLSYISPLPLFSGSNVFPYIKYDDLLLWKTLWNVCCFLIHFRPKLLSYISPLPLFSGSKEAQAQNWSIHSAGNHRKLWSICRIWNKFNFSYFKGGKFWQDTWVLLRIKIGYIIRDNYH